MHLEQAAEAAGLFPLHCSCARASSVQNASASVFWKSVSASTWAESSLSRSSISAAVLGSAQAPGGAQSIIFRNVLPIGANQVFIVPALLFKIFINIIAGCGRGEETGRAR